MADEWIQTYTGKRFDLWNPKIDQICIEDIAHHLSLINRFIGATRYPYSVAEHSINMMKCSVANQKLEALLDDAEETYYGDMSSPWKSLLKDECSGTNLWEGSVEFTKQLINEKFGLNPDHFLLKKIDISLAKTERNFLCVTPPENWKKEWEEAKVLPITFFERNWRNVEKEFLDLYNKYRRI